MTGQRNSREVTEVWLYRPRPTPRARLRLVVFPHAGAGASLVGSWPSLLPPDVEVLAVKLPGREFRVHEIPISDMAELVSQVTPVFESLEEPFVLFGHSVGALIAFEVARSRVASGLAPPAKLVVSAAPAPHLPLKGPILHNLEVEDFVAAIVDFGGTPLAVLDDPDLREILIPSLRADLAMRETYRYADARPLCCPLTAFAAQDDRRVDYEDVATWSSHTESVFKVRRIRGGHFNLVEERDSLLAALSRELLDPAGQRG